MEALAHKFKVAISDDFLDAFARVPRQQQKKVMKFVKLFKANPTASSINYEKISTFKDPNLRTARIDEAYRAIVLRPEQGNIFALLWVDNHDEAMAWAANKRYEIHPETGSLQVFTVVDSVGASTDVEPQSQPEPPPETHLFDDFRDRQLVRLGLPEAMLPTVRQLTTVEDLDDIATKLPQEAYEALFYLACGDSYEEVERTIDYRPAVPVDTEDFDAAFDNAASKQRFFVIEEDADDALVDAILNAPLEKWRVFLHPTQRKLVRRDHGGPVRVLGGAGTGKTVVAMHRAAWLAQSVLTGANDRILFTTFTKNLALDIRHNLEKLTTPEAMRRIEVVHLDKWVRDFLNQQGYKFEVDYFGPYKGLLEDLWENALALRPAELDYPTTFYREEWELVVQAQGCATLQEYFTASRAGRGVRMGRKQKKLVWPVFEEYRNLLAENHRKEVVDAMRDAARLLESKGDILPYKAIIVDEAQDMSTAAFELLRRMVPEAANDLFIVGDGHQRIYRHKVVIGRAGVKIVGRSHRLRINYRTTEEIRNFAVRLLEGFEIDDLDGGADTTDGYKSLMRGAPPKIVRCETFDEEVQAIAEYLGDGADQGTTCLVARTKNQLDRYEAALQEKGFETVRIRREGGDDLSQPGLRIATMHRVKGLEFDRVVIAGANKGVVPLDVLTNNTEDATVRAEGDLRERALFYVATTRAKRGVMISSHGEASPLLGTEDEKACPKCGRSGPVAEMFGYRHIKHTRADGTEVVTEKPQSYCRECR